MSVFTKSEILLFTNKSYYNIIRMDIFELFKLKVLNIILFYGNFFVIVL